MSGNHKDVSEWLKEHDIELGENFSVALGKLARERKKK